MLYLILKDRLLKRVMNQEADLMVANNTSNKNTMESLFKTKQISIKSTKTLSHLTTL